MSTGNHAEMARTIGVLECAVAYNRHGGYLVPLGSAHRPAAQRVLAGDVWEPETIDAVVAAAGVGDIVTAGTFFGDFLPAFATAAEMVWAFEPNPENFHCAELTVLLNRLGNVHLRHAALTDLAGPLSLQVVDAAGRPAGGGSRIVSQRSSAVTVPGVTIDGCMPADRCVAVIQLDVEGHEAEALAGGMSTIARCRPVLVLETVPTQFYEDSLRPFGYEPEERVNANTILRA